MTNITSIEDFENDLKEDIKSLTNLVDEHILFGTPHIFKDCESTYFELKKDIADFFSINPTDVCIVGSAKLGFSIAPHKLFNEFNDDSDIDIAIISEELFDKYWCELFELINPSIDLIPRTLEDDKKYHKFLMYFIRGWIRPDLFPFKFKGKENWFDFFNMLSYEKYKRKIAAGIYRNEYFLKKYHEKNMKTLREKYENTKEE